MRFTGRIAIVTGGGRGIGEATAKRLSSEGAIVVVVDRDVSEAERVAAEIRAAGGDTWAYQADVSRRIDVERLTEEVVRRHGRIDVLCSIAGIGKSSPLLEQNDEDWHATLDVNLTGVFLCLQVIGRVMATQKSGSIVNMASTNGLVGEATMGAYNASKFGVVGLTMTAAI
jgi:3-oxoacyl-[acyl-carrier protein] reductase